MYKKIGILILAVLFLGSMAWVPSFDSVDAAVKCACKADGKGCSCGKGCGCEHCKSGKGECACHKDGKGCSCGKGCGCEHCKTGKGECSCHKDGKGCSCGKGCGCAHCAVKSDDAKPQAAPGAEKAKDTK